MISFIILGLAFESREITVRLAVLIGALIALLFMSKINLGIFACFGFFFPLLALTRGRLAAGLAWCCGGVGVLLPVVLMRSDLATGHGRSLAALTGGTLLLLVAAVLLEVRPEHPLGWSAIVATAASLVTTVLAIAALLLVQGTSMAGLVNGVVLQHLHFAETFHIRAPITSAGVVTTAVSALVLALLLALGRRAPQGLARVRALILLKLLFCGAVAGCMVAEGRIAILLKFAVPFLWVALPPIRQDEKPGLARLAIVFTAAFQVLAIYPVAGSQQRVATILLILVAAVCAGDLGRHLPRRLQDWKVQVAAWLVLAAVIVPSQWAVASWNLTVYGSRVPLDLPGARRIHLDPAGTALYRSLALNLARCEGSFLSLPGMNSLYLWSQQNPPTNKNTTHWMTLLDAPTQNAIAEQMARRDGLCVVRNLPLARWWVQNRDLGEFPLVRFIDSEFRTVARIEDYELMVRRREPDPELTHVVIERGVDRGRWLLRMVLPAQPQATLHRVVLYDAEQRRVLADSGDGNRETPLAVFPAGGGPVLLAPERPGSIALEVPTVLDLVAVPLHLPGPGSRPVVLLFDAGGGLIAPVPLAALAQPQAG